MTASPPPLVTDRQTLWDKVRGLEAARPGGLDALQLEALAEAYLRLAVDPRTAPVEAVQLLNRAVACDPANPTPAYHLARLYFIHDQLPLAAEWLQRTFLICPTSHRVWVHISLLQRELFRRHRRDRSSDADALRQRSEQVLERLRAGADEIDPALLDLRLPPVPTSDLPSPPAPAPPGPALQPVRMVGAGVCRWSGMDDLEAEERLLAEPTAAGRDDLARLLDLAARRASSRPGGLAAFVVLAVAFMARGYPVVTVRRLRRLLDGQQAPSLELLDLVDELFQAGEQELPARLGDALAGGRIPPLVAAVIHHRRLLWRPLRLPTLGPARGAVRRLLDSGAEPDDQRLEALERRLRSAERELDADTPEPMADVPLGTGADVADLRSRLELLGEEAERLRGELPWLRGLVGGRPGGPLQGPDRDRVLAIATAVETVERDRKAALARLAAIKDRGADTLDEADRDLGELEAGFQGITIGPLPRLLPKARRLAEPEPEAAQADAEEDGTGRERLRRALERVDARVEGRYRDAEATLAAYSADAWRLAEMRALRILVRGYEAETRYRSGDLPAARRGWIRVLTDDPLRPAAAKNLAVAATLDGDGTQVRWWRAYAEDLYEHAIRARNLRLHAGARADLHRDLGGAWASARLAAEEPEDRAVRDELGATLFVTNAGRVRLFVRHRLLEQLNRKLDLASPTLLLGVARDEDDEIRDQAMGRLLDLIVLASASLPARVRPRFRELATARVRRAHLACQQASSRTLALDPSYEEEQARHLDWLRSICRLRRDLLDLVWAHREDLESGLEPAAVLDELVLLDALPVANSPRFLETIRHELREDEKLLRLPMHELRDNVLALATGAWAAGLRARRPRTGDVTTAGRG